MLRSATQQDIPQLREIWKSCFHDDNEYLDLYFFKRFCPRLTPVCCVDSKIVGMIHLLPCDLMNRGKAFYWYAAGIHEDFRKRGLFGEMCKTVLSELQKKNFYSVCQPAPGLESFYQKIGMHNRYYARTMKYTVQGSKLENKHLEISIAHANDFLISSAESGSVIWKKEDIEYALLENKFCHGTSLKFSLDGESYYALAVKGESDWLLDSTNISPEIAKQFRGDICSYLGTNSFQLRCIADPGHKDAQVVGLSDCPTIGENSSITFTLS